MNVLHWYTHTPRAKAQGALALLEESLAIGEWLPRASRQVRATLSKSNIAKKAAKKVQLDRSWSDPLDEEIVSVYDAAVQFLESDASYVVQTFQEAAVDTLMKAKADADAWLIGAIHRAGLDVAKTHGLQKYLQPGDKCDEE